MTTDPPAERRWGGPKVALGAILLLAAALRVVGIEYGLPHGEILNPDEVNIVPRAWDVTHGTGADPHPFFDYPSLLIYVLAPFQAWHDAPSYLTARAVAVAIGVVGVAAAWWLGTRAYGRVAGAVGATATAVAAVHVAYSRMAVTDVLLATLVTVALALIVSGRIELAGVAAGFAAAAKYPGALVLVPLVVVAWGRWQRVVGAAALAVAAFAAASPFVLAHLGEAAGDLWRVHERAREGWLGFEHDSAAPIAFAAHLWHSLGPTLVIAVLGLALALAYRTPADRALAAFVLVYFAALLPLASHFDRYVLPLVPALAVLAGRVRAIAAVTLLLLVIPLTWTVRETRELTKTDTRVFAARAYFALEGPVAVDPSLPRRETTLQLELPAPWQEPMLRNVDELRARGVRYVVLTGAVEDRVLAARESYPREAAFYDEVTSWREVLRVEEGDALAGPWTSVFQLPSAR